MERAEKGTMPWIGTTGRAYLNRLTEQLASEDFALSDSQLTTYLREMAEAQVKAGKFRAAIHLRRAAQLIEKGLGEPSR